MSNLLCYHDKTKLKPHNNPASGTTYICPKCHCRYRLVIVTNDKDCYAKRYPTASPAPTKQRQK